jgi:putative transposase
MPRQCRLEVPGLPLHVVDRGANRGAIFLCDSDRRLYLALLRRFARDHAVAVHAYVLMGNHVHLLTTSEVAGATSAMMQRLAQCHAQAINRMHDRTGPFWDGRFKGSVVDSDAYLLTVYRYIELNPVRAAICDSAPGYRWSSAAGNLGLRPDPILSPHPTFLELASDAASRVARYRELLDQAVDPADVAAIRAHVAQQKVLGRPDFQAMVERTLGRPVALRPRGRPVRGS